MIIPTKMYSLNLSLQKKHDTITQCNQHLKEYVLKVGTSLNTAKGTFMAKCIILYQMIRKLIFFFIQQILRRSSNFLLCISL